MTPAFPATKSTQLLSLIFYFYIEYEFCLQKVAPKCENICVLNYVSKIKQNYM